MSIDFIGKALRQLATVYHLAPKKIPTCGLDGTTFVPSECNGYKFELFIFDTFPLASKWLVMEVEREDEFAPIKNAPGAASDTPGHARHLMTALHVRWLKNIGAEFSDIKEVVEGGIVCEISPLKSYDGEDLEEFSELKLSSPLYLEVSTC
jgi:UDP-N-acetylglucosamine/UDP-N-acetylgalactosamine diphosphorylase